MPQRKTPLESYVEILGPHGCGNVFGRNVHVCRRIIWIVILLFGLLYTFNVISINALKYFDFPSSLKEPVALSFTIYL